MPRKPKSPAGYARMRGVSKGTIYYGIARGLIAVGPDGRIDPRKADRTWLPLHLARCLDRDKYDARVKASAQRAALWTRYDELVESGQDRAASDLLVEDVTRIAAKYQLR
jgi:hypothetical protein